MMNVNLMPNQDIALTVLQMNNQEKNPEEYRC
jgi:hypothetical protein